MRKSGGVTYLDAQEIKTNEKYGWSYDTLWRWAKQGKLKPVRWPGDPKHYYAVGELNKLRAPQGVAVRLGNQEPAG